MNIAIYARVSSDEQREKQTIQSQLDELRAFAKEKNHHIVFEFVDDGVSGSFLERPALDRLRDEARAGKFEGIVCHHVDRLSRTQLHQFLLFDEFEREKLKLFFVKLPEFSEGGEESKVVNRSVWAMVSELERLRIRERTRRGKLKKVRDGKIVCPKPIYGYRWDPERKTFTVDGDEARILQQMFEWVRDGKSSREVVRKLTSMKVGTRNGSTKWARSSVHRILARDTYATGILYFNKFENCEPIRRLVEKRYRKTNKSSHKLRERNEWIPIQLPDDCKLISQDLFDAVQKQLVRNKVFRSRKSENQHLLRGLIKCVFCGGTYYVDSYHGRPFYRCSSRYNRFPLKSTCKGGAISAGIIEPFVVKQMVDVILTPKVVIEEARKFEEKWNSEQSSYSHTDLGNQIKKLEHEKQRLVTAYREGRLELSDIDGEVNGIKLKITALTNESKKKSIDLALVEQGAERLCSSLRELIRTLDFPKKQRLMQMLIEKISFDSHQREIVISAHLNPLERLEDFQHQEMPMMS